MNAPPEASGRPDGADEAIQGYGRSLVLALYAAGQVLRLYPRENATVRNTLKELETAANRVLESEGGIDLHVTGQFLLLNGARLRLRLAEYAAFSFLQRQLSQGGIGSVRAEPEANLDDWAWLLVCLDEGAEVDGDACTHISARLLEETDGRISVDAAPEDRSGQTDDGRHGAKRTYVQSVQVAREVLTDVRIGRAVNVRRVKRAVQGIVDQVLKDETSIVGMTTLRDFDEYTFTHSVNVCIFSVVLGQKLGLEKLQLYELGLGGLFHDIGKMRLDPDLVNKPGELSDEEWREMREHPTEGLLTLFSMRGFGDVPYRTMLMAYEHHMKIDQSGYPENRRPRNPSLFGRIVAVADGFDAATSRRSYRSSPLPPDKVLQGMRDDPEWGFDPLLVKALMNVIGVYPVGTLVILDSYELAVVVAPNPDPDKIHQPVVRVIADARGFPLSQPELADLSEIDPETGEPRRTIIKTTDPEKYGIRVGNYFA